MKKNYRIVTNPSVEPVSSTDFKLFIGSTFSVDDTLLDTIILPAARQLCEKHTNRYFINTTIEQTQDSLEALPFNRTYDNILDGGVGATQALNYYDNKRFISLSGGYIQSITSLKVYDDENTESTVSNTGYYLDNNGARLVFNSSYSLPTARIITGWKVTYVAGFGSSASNIPADIKQAIMMTAQSIYQYNRTNDETRFIFQDVPAIAKEILKKYKIFTGRNGY
jgi:hypothetical protein